MPSVARAGAGWGWWLVAGRISGAVTAQRTTAPAGPRAAARSYSYLALSLGAAVPGCGVARQ